MIGMRRMFGFVALVMAIAVALVGCGTKDVESIVGDLEKKVGDLESYQGVGVMTLHTGQLPQEYQVEVWYKNPHFYRIALTNTKKDITQIVLRNDEGVYVLTPHLNKSFRFQSDWPNNQGQVYLYQSLVQSVVLDKERQFTNEENSYVFDVTANYQNPSLARQKVWFDAKTLQPLHVEVSDENSNKMVTVDFTHFEFGKQFENDSFDMSRNMTAAQLQSTPVMAEADQGVDAEPTAGEPQTPVYVEPEYLPDGVVQTGISEVQLGEGKGLLQRYSGTYNYTILQSKPVDQAASVQSGKLIDLGYTWGTLIGEDKKTFTWINDNVEFRLSSGDLPESEIIQIALSVQGQSGK
ncbi:LolA family protein [Paenibacillus senegalensis]|uniref:LolA family protein n=1 Tax=Paenibacillus senegalensis TaxID=1465766 RepID=UPI00292A4042|nr:outer membrane lipoprotein carrier protein LolA [Paenibacillus senegalensis]